MTQAVSKANQLRTIRSLERQYCNAIGKPVTMNGPGKICINSEKYFEIRSLNLIQQGTAPEGTGSGS
jgi:hypothetical protein